MTIPTIEDKPPPISDHSHNMAEQPIYYTLMDADGVDLLYGNVCMTTLSEGWNLKSLKSKVQLGSDHRLKYVDPMDLRVFPHMSDVKSDKEFSMDDCLDGLGNDWKLPLIVMLPPEWMVSLFSLNSKFHLQGRVPAPITEPTLSKNVSTLQKPSTLNNSSFLSWLSASSASITNKIQNDNSDSSRTPSISTLIDTSSSAGSSRSISNYISESPPSLKLSSHSQTSRSMLSSSSRLASIIRQRNPASSTIQ